MAIKKRKKIKARPTVAAPREGGSGPEDEAPGSNWALLLWSGTKLLFGVALVLGASTALALGAYPLALTTPKFGIRDFEVAGSRRQSAEQLARSAGVQLGENLFGVDIDESEGRLVAEPWIRTAKLSRQLPHTLKIKVSEYEARAIVAVGGKLYLVTPEGQSFKQLEAGDTADLPIITGVTADGLSLDRQREVARVRSCLALIQDYSELPLGRQYPAQEVHVEQDGTMTLSIGRQGIVLALGADSQRKKLLMAQRVVRKLKAKGRLPGVVFLDNEGPVQRVVVRMR